MNSSRHTAMHFLPVILIRPNLTIYEQFNVSLDDLSGSCMMPCRVEVISITK